MFIKKRKVRSFYLVTLVTLGALIASRFFFSFSSSVNAIASVVAYPVLLVQQTIISPIKNYLKIRSQQTILQRSYQELIKSYEDVMAENIQLRGLLSYHDQIDELVDFKKRYQTDRALTAQILLRQQDPDKQYVLLGKGARHGVVPDMVAVYKNCLIGKVDEVYPLCSKLVLVSDSSCKVAAYCVKTKASGIHVGKNSADQTALHRVSHLDSVEVGDMVLSSGEGLVFPQGFALGRIATVTLDGLYYAISVQPIINTHEIAYCTLIRKGLS